MFDLGINDVTPERIYNWSKVTFACGCRAWITGGWERKIAARWPCLNHEPEFEVPLV